VWSAAAIVASGSRAVKSHPGRRAADHGGTEGIPQGTAAAAAARPWTSGPGRLSPPSGMEMLAATGIPDRATRYGSYQRTKVELDAQIAEVERMMRLRLAGGAVTDGTVAVTRRALLVATICG